MLLGLGLKSITASSFCARAGDVYHVVGLSRDRRLGGLQIEVAIWHPSLDPSATKPSLFSPVIAMVAPDGAYEQWTWQDDSFDVVQIERVITGFFLGFRFPADLLACLPARDEWSSMQERITEATGSAINFHDAQPSYEVPGGILNVASTRKRMSALLKELCFPLGFEISAADELVATKVRGALHDCVSIRLDKHGTLASVAVFHWLPEIWRADRRLKGIYHPFNGALLHGADDRIWLINPLVTLAVADMDFMREVLNDVLAEWASRVFDVTTYVETVNSEYRLVADKILKLRH